MGFVKKKGGLDGEHGSGFNSVSKLGDFTLFTTYSFSNNHGSGKWTPERLNSSSRASFSTSISMGGRVVGDLYTNLQELSIVITSYNYPFKGQLGVPPRHSWG